MNSVETILLENIDNPNSMFIFPTDISASRWADHLLRIKGGSIAMNKFIAWDIFKQDSIKSKVQNKKSIPSALRKIFVSRLVKENAESAALGKTPVFSSLIRKEWAGLTSQFTPWLAGILPQLGSWYKKTTGLLINNILDTEAEKTILKFDGDDKDMFTLALFYSQFLDKHSLFEPAWEIPPFNDDGKEVFIFFPESLSDYSEYRELLAASNHVKTISVPETDEDLDDTFFYTNSRSEITEAALYIRALNEKLNIKWNSIALCIPDSENYEPYVQRELKNRNIPFVKRTSKPLSDYPAGQFFRSVLNCASLDFSFSSLVSLVLNKKLPWKNTNEIEKLIQFGIDNNCIYSWNEETDGEKHHIDIWEDSFNKPIEYINKDIRNFFIGLKKRVSSFRRAESFAELRKQYFIFREQFFDMEKCSEETNLILSRCISELMKLVELEKDFPEVPAVDPFLFLTEYISEVNYLAQPKTDGIAILPYKTAACAPFDYHIVLGAGQDSISVVYPRLAFLPGLKRKELGIIDEDVSEAYIKLHKYNSVKKAAFFCSEHTFSGFTIPHSKINSLDKPLERYAIYPEYEQMFASDNYNTETEVLSLSSSLSAVGNTEINYLHENQINGFSRWKTRRFTSVDLTDNGIAKKWKVYDEVKKSINSIYVNENKSFISATTMELYNQCSLNWLFNRVFNLKNTRIETSLMADNVRGLVFHTIFEDFFNDFKNKNTPLPQPAHSESGKTLPPSSLKLLYNIIDNVFNSFPALKPGGQSIMSSLTARLIFSAKDNYKNQCEKSITRFLSFFAGCSIIGCEQYYQLEKETFILRGSIDIILKDASGKYIIVDYKTGDTPKRKECIIEEGNELTNFQLPVYITLAEENEEIKINTALFYSILQADPEVIIGTIQDINTNKSYPYYKNDHIEHGKEQYNLLIDTFNKKTKKYALEIINGNFSVFPKKSNECMSCDNKRICRTVYVINRENILSMENN
ncbi:MAG: PD-(D/E)XK nuclease family protein [Treponema sp.]|nr:PD-(D/E)XK nuclease family protein [Treponema sp.]